MSRLVTCQVVVGNQKLTMPALALVNTVPCHCATPPSACLTSSDIPVLLWPYCWSIIAACWANASRTVHKTQQDVLSLVSAVPTA